MNAIPSISSQPSTLAQSYCLNATATALSITASAGSGTITNYQWYANASAINTGGTAVGTNSSNYTPLTSASGTLYYYCVVSNSNGCTKTSNVSGDIAVYASPAISNHPSTSTQNLDLNATATTLSVTATAGSGSITNYQWYSNSVASNVGGVMVGTNSSAYTPLTTAVGTLYYYCVVRNSYGCSITSNVSGAVTVSYIRVYVTQSGAGSMNGTSWANAYAGTQLQSAINQSGVNEVWVAKGTYLPTLEVGGTGSRYRTFQMKDGVAIYGGFAGTETNINQRADFGLGKINETILSGDLNGNDVISGGGVALTIRNNSENCYHVVFNNSYAITNSAVLNGFTIKGGNADGSYPDNCGGGILNSYSTPTINQVVIYGNSSSNSGGGMFITSSLPILKNLLVSNNYAYYIGAGICLETASLSMTNVVLQNNLCATAGGGLGSSNSSPLLTNVTVSGNFAASYGGGVYNTSYSSVFNPVFNNCIIWGNSAYVSGNQIFNSASSGSLTLTLNYSCYSFETNDLVNSGGNAVIILTSFNITTNPLFVNPAGGDCRINGNSPCADAGLNAYNSEVYDVRGAGFNRNLSRTDGSAGAIDMGAYEYKFGVDPSDCVNPIDGGSIGGDQAVCIGETPTVLTNVTRPSGYQGTLLYKWQSSTTSSASGFSDVSPAATDSVYSPGALSTTTWFKRLSHVSCVSGWMGAQESNVIQITRKHCTYCQDSTRYRFTKCLFERSSSSFVCICNRRKRHNYRLPVVCKCFCN